MQERIQRGVNVNLSALFRLPKPAFFRYILPEEGWFGQPKYITQIYINSSLYPFLLKKSSLLTKQTDSITCLIRGAPAGLLSTVVCWIFEFFNTSCFSVFLCPLTLRGKLGNWHSQWFLPSEHTITRGINLTWFAFILIWRIVYF